MPFPSTTVVNQGGVTQRPGERVLFLRRTVQQDDVSEASADATFPAIWHPGKKLWFFFSTCMCSPQKQHPLSRALRYSPLIYNYSIRTRSRPSSYLPLA